MGCALPPCAKRSGWTFLLSRLAIAAIGPLMTGSFAVSDVVEVLDYGCAARSNTVGVPSGNSTVCAITQTIVPRHSSLGNPRRRKLVDS